MKKLPFLKNPPGTPGNPNYVEADDMRHVHITQVRCGGMNPNDAVLDLAYQAPGSSIATIKIRVSQSPALFKAIALMMGGIVKQYEEEFGEIATGPKPSSSPAN